MNSLPNPLADSICSQCGAAINPDETVHFCRHCQITLHPRCAEAHYREHPHPQPSMIPRQPDSPHPPLVRILGTHCSYCDEAFDPDETLNLCSYCRALVHFKCVPAHNRELFHPRTTGQE